jgi:hypothetical protein
MSAGIVTLSNKRAFLHYGQYYSSDGTVTGTLEPVVHIEDAQLSLFATAAKQDANLAQQLSISNGADVTPSDMVPVTAGRLFAINCSVAGNLKVKFAGGYTFVFPVSPGLTMLPWQVVQVFVTGTTATATYANLS